MAWLLPLEPGQSPPCSSSPKEETSLSVLASHVSCNSLLQSIDLLLPSIYSHGFKAPGAKHGTKGPIIALTPFYCQLHHGGAKCQTLLCPSLTLKNPCSTWHIPSQSSYGRTFLECTMMHHLLPQASLQVGGCIKK